VSQVEEDNSNRSEGAENDSRNPKDRVFRHAYTFPGLLTTDALVYTPNSGLLNVADPTASGMFRGGDEERLSMVSKEVNRVIAPSNSTV
jgi:hypothetical protein